MNSISSVLCLLRLLKEHPRTTGNLVTNRIFSSKRHFVRTLKVCQNAGLICVEVRINIISQGKSKGIRIKNVEAYIIGQRISQVWVGDSIAAPFEYAYLRNERESWTPRIALP